MISATDMVDALAGLGVSSPPAMMVHSSVRAAVRVEGRTPIDKLETIVQALQTVAGNGNLVMPTFTYSFCEGRDFDLAASASTVGALTEYFRRRPGVRRTTDPIFSAAVAGEVAPEWEERLFGLQDVNCFGPSSVFAWLRELDAVLLFFGVGIEACTYLHHVEQRHEVPYRFFKDFHGVVHAADRDQDVTATYFVRPLDGSVEFNPERLEVALLESGRASEVTLADGPRLLVTTAREVERTAAERMTENPAFLLRSDLPAAT